MLPSTHSHEALAPPRNELAGEYLPSGQRSLSLSDRLIPPFETLHGLSRLLKQIGCDASAQESSRALLEVLASGQRSIRNLSALPKTLHEFTLATRTLGSNELGAGKDLAAAARQIVASILQTVATIVLQRHFGKAASGLILLGQGEFNWVLGDETRVVYLSKGNLPDQYGSYRVRKYCTTVLQRSIPSHPLVNAVGSVPFPYAIGDTFLGRSLRHGGEDGKESVPPTPVENDFSSSNSFSLVGEYLRLAFTHSGSKFGPIAVSRGEAQGRCSSWREHTHSLLAPWINPTPEDSARLNELCERFPALRTYTSALQKGAQRLSELEEQQGLILTDPAMPNFLLSSKDDTVACVDWDRASISYRCEAVGRLLYSWYISSEWQKHSTKSFGDTERRAAFKTALRSFVPDTQDRLAVKRHAVDWLSLRLYWMLANNIRPVSQLSTNLDSLPFAERFMRELIKLRSLETI